MDLRGLVKHDSKGEFLKKGRNKEEKKDAYKKPSRAPNTASEARTLRTLQVNPIVSYNLVGGRHQMK